MFSTHCSLCCCVCSGHVVSAANSYSSSYRFELSASKKNDFIVDILLLSCHRYRPRYIISDQWSVVMLSYFLLSSLWHARIIILLCCINPTNVSLSVSSFMLVILLLDTSHYTFSHRDSSMILSNTTLAHALLHTLGITLDP